MNKSLPKTHPSLIPQNDAMALLPVESGKPIRVYGSEAIRQTFCPSTLKQAINSRQAPGIEDLTLNPDAHVGYGAPIGCVMSSRTHIYPGPVGVDIKCSMSLLQLDIDEDVIADKRVRRALIDAICERIPTGAGRGQRQARKSRRIHPEMGRVLICEGATKSNLEMLGIPRHWRHACEESVHLGHDDTTEALYARYDWHVKNETFRALKDKIEQIGSYGGGNHFGECEVVRVADNKRAHEAAKTFGLKDGKVAFLSHCGSRGFGAILADHQFKQLQGLFDRWSIPYPGGDRQLCYAPLGTSAANAYIDDMHLASNFATINHLMINALVLEAFQEVIPGITGELVYLISHNIARKELDMDGGQHWVMRKGATRAFPAGHPALAETRYATTGHPILLPGDPQAGSSVMVAESGAKEALFSINHGAGRQLGRKAAIRSLNQKEVNDSFETHDILYNGRNYPLDEAPDAYKDFDEVLRSVSMAGLASEVARLHARFVIKDAGPADD